MNRRTLPRTLLRGGIPAAAVAALALAGTWSASADTAAYNGYDAGGDGWYETFGFDADADGIEDTWTFDTDNDGAVESVAVDTDDDGRPDAWGFDADTDGYVEEVALDTTADARPDVWGTDTDADGAIDRQSSDTDDDGYADVTVATDMPESTDPFTVTFVLDVLHTDAGGWDAWTPRFAYGSGYGYDAEAAAQDEAGVPEHVGAEPVAAANSTTTAPAATPDVMVMASAQG